MIGTGAKATDAPGGRCAGRLLYETGTPGGPGRSTPTVVSARSRGRPVVSRRLWRGLFFAGALYATLFALCRYVPLLTIVTVAALM